MWLTDCKGSKTSCEEASHCSRGCLPCGHHAVRRPTLTLKIPRGGEWDALESRSVLPCHLTPDVWKLCLWYGQILASKTEIFHLITIHIQYKHMRYLKKWFSCVHLAYRTMRNNCSEPLYFVSCHMVAYLSILMSPLICCVPLCTSSYKSIYPHITTH